jgi:hypothetical protein
MPEKREEGPVGPDLGGAEREKVGESESGSLSLPKI